MWCDSEAIDNVCACGMWFTLTLYNGQELLAVPDVLHRDGGAKYVCVKDTLEHLDACLGQSLDKSRR